MRGASFLLLSFSAGWSFLACVGDDPGEFAEDAGSDGATTDPSRDGASGSDVVTEAGPTGPCDLAKPFSRPMPMTDVSELAIQTFPRLSPDREELYVSRSVGGRDGVVVFRREDGGAWGSPTALTALNDIGDGGPMNSSALTMTADSKTAFFGRNSSVGVNRGISKMTRGGPKMAWSNHSPVDVRDATGSIVAETPWVNSDGTRLYFGSNVGGYARIFQAPLANGFYGPAKAIAFDANEWNPVLSADELRIYVTSFRAHPIDSGAPNQTAFVYTATRPAINEPFGLPDYVSELNIGFSEMNPAWLSPDGCTMLLWGRPPGSNRLDLYSATKPPY